MPIFPYDNEEERRRRMLTPGINGSLPEIALPKRPLAPPAGMPGAIPAPDYNPPDMAPPSRYQRLQAEKQGYMRGTPGRGKSALTGALEGFLGGGGLVGAATGAVYGAAAPKQFRERQFEQYKKPQLLEQFAYEDADRAAARQAEQDVLNNQYRTAQIGELESQAYKNRLPPPAPRPITVGPGATAVNPTTGKPVFSAPAAPERPVYRDLVDSDGQIRTYQIHADGSKTLVGGAAAAAINKANIQSREKVASQREAGVNARESRRSSAGKKETIPLSKVRAYAKEKGIKLDEAKARVINEGYKIVGTN